MACNCNTQEEINKIYAAYGEKSKLPEQAKITDYLKYYVGNTLLYILLIITLPFLVLYVMCLLFWREDERIHVNDVNILRLLKPKSCNVRKQ